MEPEQAYQTLVPRLKKTATNRDFLAAIIQQSNGNAGQRQLIRLPSAGLRHDGLNERSPRFGIEAGAPVYIRPAFRP